MTLTLLCALAQGVKAQTEVSTESELTSAGSNGGSVKLICDITLSTTLNIKEDMAVTIDLNGYTLSRGLKASEGSTGHVIELRQGSWLTIKDSSSDATGTITGGYSDAGGAIYNHGTLTIEGGTITGNKATGNGGGICNRGVMYMKGGNISDNSSPDGGGIYNEFNNDKGYIGVLVIEGGTITGNTSTEYGGGGITNWGSLMIFGGTISGNTCQTNGGGIWTYNSLTMEGGTITGNRAGNGGGGIYANSGTLEMSGKPVVRDNTGSNLYLNDNMKVTLTGALAQGACLYISMQTYNREFTAGYSIYHSGLAATTYFHSDLGSLGDASLTTSSGGELMFNFGEGKYYITRTWDENDKLVVTHIHEQSADIQRLDDQTTLSGWYYSDYNNTYEAHRVTISGDTHLILKDGTTLTCEKGIYIAKDATLYIHTEVSGTGQLRCTGGDSDHAALGGNRNTVGGHLVIYGGTVYAAANHNNAAGIGGGKGESGGMQSITIYGGSVTAKGKKYAAGIGGGRDNDNGGTITIYGGSVTATSGDHGAGIGGGYNRGNWPINIYGGTINAESDDYGAGIGSGGHGALNKEINIYGGVIRAEGGEYGPGIGSGTEQTCNASINISNAHVTALGHDGAAGIGGGREGSNYKIKIENSIVYAESIYKSPWTDSYNGAGIGGGHNHYGGEITIVNSDVTAISPTCSVPINGTKKDCPGRALGDGPSLFYETNKAKLHFGNNLRIKVCKKGVWSDGNPDEINDLASDNKEVRLMVCEHPEGLTYAITETGHTHTCKYCNYKKDQQEEAHTYNASHVCIVCGYVLDSRKNIVTVYDAATDGTGYDSGTQHLIIQGNDYSLPAIDETGVPPYMVFEGWLQDPVTAPTAWETTGGEDLLATGSRITPTTDVKFYARYSYQYGTEWTWTTSTKSASATLKIINLENNTLVKTFTSDDNEVAIHASPTVNPTKDEPGHITYFAEVNYTDEKGRNFIFTDDRTQVWYLGVGLDEDDNTTTLADNDGGIVTATLTGRTLYKDGYWNTLCLPFDVEIAGSPLAGATVKELTDASFANGTLTLTFADATSIKAGQAYLIKWGNGNNLGPSDLIFNGVTLTKDLYEDEISTDDSGTATVTFMGTYKKLSYDADDRSILLLGANNTLYYPQSGASLGAQRAYFKLSGITAGDKAAGVRSFVLDFGGDDGETTGIMNVQCSMFNVQSDNWYSIDGRKLAGKPTQKGLYINKGVKIVIK